MSKLLFIDSDDITSLSVALIEALERRGITFGNKELPCNQIGAYNNNAVDNDSDWLFQETGGVRSYGGCGQIQSQNRFHSGGCGDSYTPSYDNYAGGCGGGCGYTPARRYGGCGGGC